MATTTSGSKEATPTSYTRLYGTSDSTAENTLQCKGKDMGTLTFGFLVSWSLRINILPILMDLQHSLSPFSMASPAEEPRLHKDHLYGSWETSYFGLRMSWGGCTLSLGGCTLYGTRQSVLFSVGPGPGSGLTLCGTSQSVLRRVYPLWEQ
jgi:hypothetical protein